MDSSIKLNDFLLKYNFSDIKVSELSNALLADMSLGLQENDKSQQLMAVMPFEVNTKKTPGKVLVIDAGGTNFRSCLVEFLEDGSYQITEEKKSSMIALDREYTKEEFFNELEEKIHYLKNKADEIHFCFSYAMKSLPDGDAQVVTFSKQVKAKAVAGSIIGKELMKVLQKKGWSSVKKIKVVNDTLACLLAGVSDGTENFDSYIGFILGTGINNAYIEKGKIGKMQDNLESHIVVCECGMFKSVPLSDFDVQLDKQSTNPGLSLLEKMCSGVYVGKISRLAILAACEEGLFSSDFSNGVKKLPEFSAYEISLFLEDSGEKDNILGHLCDISQVQDKVFLKSLLNAVIQRSAKISAAVIMATAIKSSAKNICITCNGSTFWKSKGLKASVEEMLKKELTKNNGINFSILKVENDITLGTALA